MILINFLRSFPSHKHQRFWSEWRKIFVLHFFHFYKYNITNKKFCSCSVLDYILRPELIYIATRTQRKVQQDAHLGVLLLKSISVFVRSTEKRERMVGIKSSGKVWRPLNRGRNGPIPTCRSRLYYIHISISLYS